MNNISDNHHYNVIRCKFQVSQYIIIQPDCGFDVDLLWFEVELHTFPNEITRNSN